jgi:hypothetical protein
MNRREVYHPARRHGGRVALCEAANVNWLTHARACVLFSAPEDLILGMGAISDDLVSQRREKPKTR